MSTTNLIGQVFFVGNLNPTPHVKIEIWQMDSTSDGNTGVLISVMADAEGKFNVDIIGSIEDGTSLLFKIFKGQAFIYELPLTYAGEGTIMQIEVPTELYDQKVVDNVVEGDDINYMLVSGVLSGVEGLVIKNATINVYESGFRTRTLLASTSTDQFGYYKLRINVRSIVNTRVINNNSANRSILVEALSPDGTTLATSSSNSSRNNTITIDLTATDDSTYVGLTVTAFEHLVSQIDYITDNTDIESITGYTNGDSEVEVIANAIGLNSNAVAEIVKSYRYTSEISFHMPKLMYPLVAGSSSDINPALSYSYETVKQLIIEGIDNNLIPNTDTGQIDAFVEAIKAYQVSATKTIPIEDETFTFGDVLLPAFGGDMTKLDNFLSMYNGYQNRPVNEFWKDYEVVVGEQSALKTRMGMQLSGITANQPEVIAALLADVEPYGGIHELATWTEIDWNDKLNNINNSADRVCVPSIIMEASGGDSIIAVQTYAATLKSAFFNFYPLTTIRSVLESGTSGIIDNTEQKEDAILFIRNNPEFDMRLATVHDITPDNCDLDGIADVEKMKESLAPIQRLMRVAGGNPDAIIAMKAGGLQSAGDVTDISKDVFAETYKDAFGSREIALEAHNTAIAIQAVATSTATYIGTSSHPAVNQIPVLPNYAVSLSQLNLSSASPMAFSPTSAAFSILSGSKSYCSCRECLSLYSPAAYLTDILNFIRKRTKSERNVANNNDGFLELIRRRPDLLHIDLSCKNTNTVLPYIDLVNEILESHILRIESRPNIPDSYQTSGTAAILAAHPEHVEKSSGVYVDNNEYEYVYDNVLSQAKYPFSLPFSLALEQSRVYLKHLGISRYDLMKNFRAYNFTPTSPAFDTVSDYLIYSEFFGISFQEAKIITAYNDPEPWTCYGVKASTVNASNGIPDPTGATALLTGSWNVLLTGRLDVLLQQTGIEYLDLLHFLQTDILNLPNNLGEREIYVTNIAGFDEETCALNELKLAFTGVGGSDIVFLKKLYRFIRLWRAYKLSVNEWDVVFRSLNITDISNIDNSNDSEFQRLNRVLALSDRLRISPLFLAAWWNNVDTHQYTNFSSELLIQSTSVYDKIFRDRSVINSPLVAFPDLANLATGSLPPPNLFPSSYVDYTSIIASCCNIDEDALIAIMQYLSIDISDEINITALSRIYALSQVSKALQISAKDFIKTLQLTVPETTFTTSATVPVVADITNSIAQLESILERAVFVKSSRFSLDELYYLVINADTTGGALLPNNKNIQVFYEDLRTSLKSEPIYAKTAVIPDPSADLKERLENIIYEKFTKEFDISRDMLNLVFPDLVTENGDAEGFFYDLINADFIASDIALTPDAEIPESEMPVIDFYIQYQYLNKVYNIAKQFKLNFEELKYLYANSTKDIVGLNFRELPITSAPVFAEIWPLLKGVLMADNWTQLKAKLNFIDNDLVQVWQYIALNDKAEFMALLNTNNNWAEGQLSDLIGADNVLTASGILNVAFAGNFAGDNPATIGLFYKLLTIFNWSRITGLNAVSMNQLLLSSPALRLADSQKVLLAAKSKYNEATWLKVAKPLRDELRKKQRKALTDYIITATNPGAGQNWRTSNDVYAWFLIDVDMEPCTMTSRLRLALSSVQLYMDRILLGIENYFISTINSYRVTVDPAYIQQWEAWRKWYRIWEANRKVFLYPENWIEPELRDNKSVFFEELEARLLENELNMNAVTDAVKEYLYKLNDVARLEPVGNYYEQRTIDKKDRSIMHAFARTYGKPNRYYYRRLVLNEWTPWERIELDIKSEHVVPYVWNGKLHLFWLTTRIVRVNARKKYIESDITGSNNKFFHNDILDIIGNSDLADGSSKNSTEQLEITLNWSEYRNGHWQDHKIGTEKMLVNMNRLLTNELSNSILIRNYYRQLTKNKDLTLPEFMASRLFMYLHYNQNSAYFQAIISFPLDINERKYDNAHYLHSFIFPDDNNADCRVLKEKYLLWNQPAPDGTLFSKQKFTQKVGTTKLFYSSYTSSDYNKFYVYEAEADVIGSRLNIFSSVDIFRKLVPGDEYYKITSGSAFRELPTNYSNPMGDRFFFEDKKNIYFAYKTKFQPQWLVAGPNYTKPKTPFDLYPVEDRFPKIGEVIVTTNIYGKFKEAPVTPLLPISEIQANPATGKQLAIIGPSYVTPVMTAATPAQQPISSAFSTFSNQMVAIPEQIDVYKFITFYHPQVKHFFALLNGKGMDALMALSTQTQIDTMAFYSTYLPTERVQSGPNGIEYPKDIVYFDYKEAYACYNWELFYHVPMLVAQRLYDDRKFAEARKWYHYIFDPTANTNDSGLYTSNKERFWRFRPFYELAKNDIETIADLLEDISNNLTLAKEQVAKWENNPFQPHLLARMRTGAYMRNTLMKYLDNLIAWGDMLFKQDTIESLNEATQLYILAANLLGPKPKELPQRAYSAPHSYQELIDTGTMDDFSNAIVEIETLIDNNLILNANNSNNINNNSVPDMPYFCLTANDKLLAYWDTIADRLFKIRNCMNIDGVVRQLPLFDPPIDPGMLVKAAAAGIDMASVLNDISSANQPIYRYSVYVQKANELCGDVKALGGALLSALEKKDAEQLALIRSAQELSVLEAMKQVKQQQIEETTVNLEALELTKSNTEYRLEYYNSRAYTNNKEAEHIEATKRANQLQITQSRTSQVSSYLAAIPQFHTQAPFAIGPTFGGSNLSAIYNALSAHLGVQVMMRQSQASMAATLGSYDRRMDDWQFQAESARKEIAQLDKQILASQIKISIAEKELENQELQIRNTQETDAFMRSKFTNKELYSWMISQISTTYFQSYQIAYDLAKRAEKAYNNELAFATPPAAGYIQFGYWDSLKKGLMAGEKLQLDIRKMEAAYMENNKRELELTKDVSLLMLNPESLIELKETGTCEFTIPSWLFELDYMSHYFRRIKSISISIPCVAGPYTTIASRLDLANAGSSFVINRKGESIPVKGSPTYSIATSNAQNDSGVFELNFRDERYLPFEGYGIENSIWTLSMMTDKGLRQFDYNTINDVVLHVRYTAQEGREDATGEGNDTVEKRLQDAFNKGAKQLPRYFTSRHDFSNEWFNAFSTFVAVESEEVGRLLDIDLLRDQFPYYCKDKKIQINTMQVFLIPNDPVPATTTYMLQYGNMDPVILPHGYMGVSIEISNMSIDKNEDFANCSFIIYKEVNTGIGVEVRAIDADELMDVFLVFTYDIDGEA